MMVLMYFCGKYMTWLFISPSETEVVDASVLYFRTVFWCYPFLGSIFLYRNTLQGMGYGLVPMLGGVFELVARTLIVMLVAGHTSFTGVCLSDSGGMDCGSDSSGALLYSYYEKMGERTKRSGAMLKNASFLYK